ncbi:MAG: hypothetical protein HYW70_01935 [Candidatus Nealsonbacteria bacterium]|nr:hypothetical protein [Candidatus Nealsonbacteria bacterium]
MPLEIKKRERENIQGLLYRFKKAIQGSGILLRAREGSFKRRSKSKSAKKKSILRRLEANKEHERKRKFEKPNA